MAIIQIIIQCLTLFGVGYVILLDLKIGKKRNKLRELEMKIFKKEFQIEPIDTKSSIRELLKDKEKSEKVVI